MKPLLLGLLLASPPIAAWMLGDADQGPQHVPYQPLVSGQENAVTVPVEVVVKGSPSQWVYVEVAPQAVPEPGVVSLLALASLFLLRRARPSGK